jgi:hypothetical protein
LQEFHVPAKMSSKSEIIGELSRMTGKKSVFLTTSSLRDKVNLEK